MAKEQGKEEQGKKEQQLQKKEGRAAAPYQPFLAPFREMERLMSDLMGRRSWFLPSVGFPEEIIAAPAIDVYEENDSIVVKAELPGVEKNEVSVDVTDHMVTISGEKKKEEKISKQDYYRLERSYGAFNRTIMLPEDVQTDKGQATFENGVLEIKFPKTEEAKHKRKKIEIK